jgi:hypothetical protein
VLYAAAFSLILYRTCFTAVTHLLMMSRYQARLIFQVRKVLHDTGEKFIGRFTKLLHA